MTLHTISQGTPGPFKEDEGAQLHKDVTPGTIAMSYKNCPVLLGI